MPDVTGVPFEEAVVLGRGTRLVAGAMTVACVVLLGPSAPSGVPFAGALPAGAAEDVVPNRVMTWNICNPCRESNVGRAAEIATYAPQVVGLQEACVRDVEKIRDYLESLYGLVYHVEYGMVLRNRGRCGGTPWSPGAFGQALLSAAPMTDRVSVEYPDGGSEDRGYMAVTTTVGGESVRVFNTHLAQRRQQDVRAGQTGVLAAAELVVRGASGTPVSAYVYA
ncbi:endonuclease/exonuclease/phosphatase family protein, partial [Streptomyces sp. NPDC020875]|uniref:endonuclease/exonuclease/phosphatase family protein n=1 Tax=Streptomyces sp. NPDC020875 TaxID=3154898 RepID=UPI0033E760B2